MVLLRMNSKDEHRVHLEQLHATVMELQARIFPVELFRRMPSYVEAACSQKGAIMKTEKLQGESGGTEARAGKDGQGW